MSLPIKFDPYLLYLALKSNQSQQILQEILTQLFERSFAYLKSYQFASKKEYNERFNNTKEKYENQKDPYCNIMLKGIINKLSVSELRQQYNIEPLKERFKYNENNYFLVYLCTRVKQITNVKNQLKYAKMSKILKIPQNQIQYIERYQKPQAKESAIKKFNFLLDHREDLMHLLSPFVNSLLRIVQKQIRFQNLFDDFSQKLQQPCFESFPTQIWIKFLQIESEICINQKQKYQWQSFIKPFQKPLRQKLNRLIKDPKCFISETLYRIQQRYLRKIYFKRLGQKFSNFLFSSDWNMDFLGRPIIQKQQNIIDQSIKSNFNKNIQSQFKTNNNQHEEILQEKNNQLQQLEKMEIQNQCSEEKSSHNQKKQQQNPQCKQSLHQSAQSLEGFNIKNIKPSVDPNSVYYKDWLVFLMKEANHFQQRVCKKRLGISNSQFNRYFNERSKISYFKKNYPNKLNKILSNRYTLYIVDQDQLELLNMIANKQKYKGNQFEQFLERNQKEVNMNRNLSKKTINLNKRNPKSIMFDSIQQQPSRLSRPQQNITQPKYTRQNKNIEGKQLNSREIAQKNVLFYLVLRRYKIQNPFIQIILKMTTDQIKEYYIKNRPTIQQIGKQCLQFYQDNLIKVEAEREVEVEKQQKQQIQQSKLSINSLLKTHLNNKNNKNNNNNNSKQ